MILKLLSLSSFAFFSFTSAAFGIDHGIRLDPSYLYADIYQDMGIHDARTAARVVSEDVKSLGFNTIYLFAYNPVYGAFYKTSYSHTEEEQSFGRENFLRYLLDEAHLRGIKVIAGVPVNNFKKAWQDNKDWRVKTKKKKDYRPNSDTFPISPHSSSFQKWYEGFLNDLLINYPDIDGVEAIEGMIDWNWDNTVDFNPEAAKKFKKAYPKEKPGSRKWKQFRSSGLTELHRILFSVSHFYGKQSFVVQPWTARADGTLMTSQEISDGCGFDYDGITNLPAPGNPDVVIAELIWQQWYDTYRTNIFNPQWTARGFKEVQTKIKNNTVKVYGHVELSLFGQTQPTVAQFGESLASLITENPLGTSMYDYNYVKTMKAETVIKKHILKPSIEPKIQIRTLASEPIRE